MGISVSGAVLDLAPRPVDPDFKLVQDPATIPLPSPVEKIVWGTGQNQEIATSVFVQVSQTYFNQFNLHSHKLNNTTLSHCLIKA